MHNALCSGEKPEQFVVVCLLFCLWQLYMLWRKKNKQIGPTSLQLHHLIQHLIILFIARWQFCFIEEKKTKALRYQMNSCLWALETDLCNWTQRQMKKKKKRKNKVEAPASSRLKAFLLHMRPFSLHVDIKQNLSLALTNTQAEKGLDRKRRRKKKLPLNRERQQGETDKRREREREWSEERIRQGVAEGFSLENLL